MDIIKMCIMSMASEVMKLIFVVLDVSFNSGRYTVIIKQFLYINDVTPTVKSQVKR